MWRPDNWEEVKPRNTSEGCASGAYNNGVEAGADAMHKADIKWILEHILYTRGMFTKEDWIEFTSEG